MTARKKKGAVDQKSAAANDQSVEVVESPAPDPTPAPVAEPPAPIPARNVTIATGAKLHQVAGSPSKPQVVACFGTGYALSWANRAAKLNMDPVELATLFKNDPEQCKKLWEGRQK